MAEAAATPLVLAHQLRQLRNIHRNPPRLVFGEQLRRRSAAGLILEIDIGQLLPGAVRHDKAGVQFLDSPRRREATGGRHVMTITDPYQRSA
jgi:hypothetical protein